MTKKIKKCIVTVLLTSLIACTVVTQENMVVQAADKTLSLQQAQKVAIAKSSKRVKILNKIELQEIKYSAAVKSIQMKKKNMSTFRWTPLLSFKFPEQPTLADEYEWQYKPLQITSTISSLQHQLLDDQLETKESVSNLYVQIYINQEKIAFLEENLEQAQTTLTRNQARLAVGEATQSDIDKLQQSIDRLTTDISLQKRSFETNKSKLSKLINQDVTTGYTFQNPLQQADIPRNILDNLIRYTLDNDQSYYEAKMDTRLAYTGMNMMESMMRSQYGNKMNNIMPFINQIKAGDSVDSGAFKNAYKQMLDNVDAPWNGTIRILFIRIKKEWFKGAVDGSRYVEDDPYALYTGALEYMDALKEQNSLQDELTNSVKSGFETLKTAQIAYNDAKKSCDILEQEVEKNTRLNLLGKVSYEELGDLQEEYRNQESETLDLLAEYTQLLYSYDRLTCGGITAYLEGTDVDMKATQGGNSFIAKELEGKAYYYINYRVEDNIFVMGVSIPDNYSLDITDYALYVNDMQIGDVTPIDEELEHLALDLDQVDKAQIFLYDGQELVDVREIDSSVNQAELPINGGYELEHKESVHTVASYIYTLQKTTNTVSMKITPKASEQIAYYRLTDTDGNAVNGDELIPIDEEFTYLSLLVGDLSGLHIIFYDAQEQELYQGMFNTGSSTITVIE
ncbi:MAG: hypothetical protein EGP77_04030 [Lachnospiraceae bacterium]|nr:hypothetical protein [Lachnospiraceae bacterium]